MKDLNELQIQQVNGAGIHIGKLIGGMVSGALAGLLRGIPGGPMAMIGSAIAGAGMGAVTVAVSDAAEIKHRKDTNQSFSL